MIRRRDDHSRWLLIEQIEHARVAAELATHWNDPAWQSLCQQSPIIATITHHDDGWADWDSRPGLHPDTGLPRDFTEMRLQDSTTIWERSIAVCRQLAPIAGFWVSRHFCWLAEQSLANRTDSEDREAAQGFLDRQQRQFSTAVIDKTADDGLRWLQMFDRLSLWLCCEPATEPRSLPTPSGTMLRFAAGPNGQELLSPWPFRSESLQLMASAHRIRARHDEPADDSFCDLDLAEATEIHWTLTKP